MYIIYTLVSLIAGLLIGIYFKKPSANQSALSSSLDLLRKELQVKTESLLEEREELSILMNTLSDAILVINQNQKPIYFNPKFTETFGNPHLLQNTSGFLEVFFRHPDILQGFSKVLTQSESHTLEIDLAVKNHSLSRYFQITLSQLKKKTGEIYGVLSVFKDITEVKYTEKMRIDFVANVSHELRTPLTAIKGYTDTLLTDLNSNEIESSKGFLKIISRNVDRLMHLVTDLLDLSSLESGIQLHKTTVNVKDITQHALTQLEPKRAAKKHVITTHFEIEHIQADGNRLEQVIINLVDNAIKYLVQPGKIEIIWKSVKNYSVLIVKDNGPGISEEQAHRIFERFFRVDKAREREIGGTGLGLAIVKHIMQRHGGQIRVESKVSLGTQFICEFPNT